jgi:hypothetical protein
VVALLHAGDLEAVALDAAQDLVACLLHRPVGRGRRARRHVGVGAVGSPDRDRGRRAGRARGLLVAAAAATGTTRTRPATTAATVCRSTSLLPPKCFLGVVASISGRWALSTLLMARGTSMPPPRVTLDSHPPGRAGTAAAPLPLVVAVTVRHPRGRPSIASPSRRLAADRRRLLGRPTLARRVSLALGGSGA